MMFLAENLREIMAELGFKTIDEMVGHTEVIKPRFVAKGKAKTLDFSRILGNSLGIKQKTHEPFSMNRQWLELDNYATAAIDSKQQTVIEQSINNVQRAVGARMGGWIAQRFGNNGLAEGLLHYTYYGIAGQSFASFIPQGMELKLIGEANDYVAKGLSGGRLIIVPPKDAAYDLQNSPIVGNVACFGANAGQGFFRGLAGERFCVRNSGADVVVEGCGDHGCEYMTGGVAVVLGKTGRNFGAGMSGGIAYVYDPDHNFYDKCNHEMVELFALDESGDDSVLKELLEKHLMFTDSLKAAEILDQWEQEKQHFVKVYPVQYHKMMDATEEMRQLGLRENELANKAFESVVGKQLSFPSERE